MNYTARIQQVRNFYKTTGRMPSVAETATIINVASKNTAALFLQKLCEDGFAIKDTTGKLSPGWRLRELPLLGLVTAGFPAYGEEQFLQTSTLDDLVIRAPESTYLLRITGDSMKDAGILDGDYVVVERTDTAPKDSIIVAEIDGEYTVKYYRPDHQGSPHLHPANSQYPILQPKQSFSIHAQVVGVVRPYT